MRESRQPHCTAATFGITASIRVEAVGRGFEFRSGGFLRGADGPSRQLAKRARWHEVEHGASYA